MSSPSTATIYAGDCVDIVRQMPDASVDLVLTSPPYADSRRTTYGGIVPDKYVEWFLPRSEQFLRVLKPTGSFVLNIKEKAVDGERHTYVLELIIALRKQGWLWTEEYIWHKKNCFPGKWPNRFRDAWERCLHFTKAKKFKMNQDAVRVPMGDWADSRLRSLGKNDVVRYDSQVGSGFGKNIANWQGRTMAYPTNVLHLATECGNKEHSAAFPRALPEWFIKLLTDEGDTVLDPFAGSGTTCEVAIRLNRAAIGVEILPQYFDMAQGRIRDLSLRLLEKASSYEPDHERSDNGLYPDKPAELSQGEGSKFDEVEPTTDFEAQEPVSV